MKYLIVGIITQLTIIFSIQYIFRHRSEGGEGCIWSDRGAKRGVLILSHGECEVDGRVGGRIQYQQGVLQWVELFPVLAGIKDHVVFGRSSDIHSVLDLVEGIIYVGPDGVLDKFQGTNRFLFTYPISTLEEEPLIDNDKFVFQTINQLISSSQCNDTIQEALVRKVLIILYLTSAALAGLKYPNNETMLYETQHFLSKEMLNFQNKLKSFYSDEDTVFLSVPHWAILEDRNSKLKVWGRGASVTPSSTIELADVCPLLASLMGVPVPRESVGRLPLSYLNISQEEEAKALACNAFQLHQLVFTPELSYWNQSVSSITDYIGKKQYARSKLFSEQMIKISQSHLHRSRQTFDRIIFSVVIISLIGWIFLLMIVPMIDTSTYGQITRSSSIAIIIAFTTIFSFEIFYVTLELKDPLIYVVFMLLTLLPWMLVFFSYKTILHWCLGHANVQTLLNICAMILLEEALNASFNGGFVTVFFITLIGSLPLLPRFHSTPFLYSVGWCASCALIIGLLNVPIGLLKAKRKLINFASTFWLCLGQSSVFYFDLKYDAIISQVLVVYMACSTILCNAFIVMPYAPPYWYYLSWLMFTAFVFPLIGKNKTFNRLLHFSLSFGPSLLLMSRNIESLSYFVLVFFFICWVYLERSHMTTSDDHWCNLRRGFLLVFSCCLGYHLTGKIESHTPTSLLTPFIPIHFYLHNPMPFYGMLFFKHLAVHTTLMTIYISLINNKWKTDRGFVYGLIFIEIICLRFFMQLFFFDRLSEIVFKNIFFNMFAISYMVSYCLGRLYSTKYVQKEMKDLSILYFLQNSTS